ncbi:hypothetical protein ACFWP2_33980 [Kitasatospora sp. NPDC058444]|uniref:hypothetical protein n=1 Tax=Kitasatospora sp. NPDC058444 TaxID=3346504 RepID=UPI0036527746
MDADRGGQGRGTDDQRADPVTEALRDLAGAARAGVELEKQRERYGFFLGLAKAALVFAGDIVTRFLGT